MSVRIRLTRAGRKKVPHYRIVVMDSRNRRDGAYLDQIGVYHPNLQPAQFEVNEEKALRWLTQGAVPSDTVRSLLSQRGILLRFDLMKRQTPPEKIAATLATWREAAAARTAQRAEQKKLKRKGKASAESAATS
ncbi:MAG TPA: 30S ribosomal protein S16 [bacterium]